LDGADGNRPGFGIDRLAAINHTVRQRNRHIHRHIRLVVPRHDRLVVSWVVFGKLGVAGGAGADDAGEEGLYVSEYAVKGHSGTAAFGRWRSQVRKPWAAATRVTWWCQPAHLRPS
jgi:hypothetical protein